MIRIALRLDDPSATSDHVLERDILAVLEELNIPLTAAVIPLGRNGEPIRADNVPHLVKAHAAGLLEIAQHGWTHEPLYTDASGKPSEFMGVPSEEQLRRIKAGRQLLETAFQTRIPGFVPPWNSCDAATLNLLADQGFDYVSISSALNIRHMPKLRLVPHTCNLNQLEGAYLQAKRQSSPTSIIAILHHYDFRMSDETGVNTISFPSLRKTLDWLRDDPDVEFSTLEKVGASLSIRECWQAYQRRCKVIRMHWRMRRQFPNYLLLNQPLWRYLIFRGRRADT